MNRQIQEAFDQIVADQNLIDETKKRLREQRSTLLNNSIPENSPERKQKIEGSKKNHKLVYGFSFATVAAACLILGIFLGFNFKINSKPVSYISIDVNPSIELCLNKDNVVISADAWNSDGDSVLNCVRLKGKSCEKAVQCLLECEEFQQYLVGDCDLNITVIGESDIKAKELEQLLKKCRAYIQNNGSCVLADMDVYEEAHEHEMSFGKYLLYKELHELDDTVSVEDCQHMSIKEIRDHIKEHETHEAETGHETDYSVNEPAHDSDHSSSHEKEGHH